MTGAKGDEREGGLSESSEGPRRVAMIEKGNGSGDGILDLRGWAELV